MQQSITSVFDPSKEKQKIGVSSLKIFDGEDLSNNSHYFFPKKLELSCWRS